MKVSNELLMGGAASLLLKTFTQECFTVSSFVTKRQDVRFEDNTFPAHPFLPSQMLSSLPFAVVELPDGREGANIFPLTNI